MYNTRYLPEHFEQCRLEKTVLRQFSYNLNVRSSWNALIQDGGNSIKRLMDDGCESNFLPGTENALLLSPCNNKYTFDLNIRI